ncbi:hypothetical protein EGW08_008290 [Elysia chlorotica]|uniref:Uncharacterized protein n=1 Tax=Elysia chlorotica TaxID=188477 RepID=A0A433TQR3_ELYCH|nr:hypothetical protein EGW08_008290 [Elysia chlorotica]
MAIERSMRGRILERSKCRGSLFNISTRASRGIQIKIKEAQNVLYKSSTNKPWSLFIQVMKLVNYGHTFTMHHGNYPLDGSLQVPFTANASLLSHHPLWISRTCKLS